MQRPNFSPESILPQNIWLIGFGFLWTVWLSSGFNAPSQFEYLGHGEMAQIGRIVMYSSFALGFIVANPMIRRSGYPIRFFVFDSAILSVGLVFYALEAARLIPASFYYGECLVLGFFGGPLCAAWMNIYWRSDRQSAVKGMTVSFLIAGLLNAFIALGGIEFLLPTIFVWMLLPLLSCGFLWKAAGNLHPIPSLEDRGGVSQKRPYLLYVGLFANGLLFGYIVALTMSGDERGSSAVAFLASALLAFFLPLLVHVKKFNEDTLSEAILRPILPLFALSLLCIPIFGPELTGIHYGIALLGFTYSQVAASEIYSTFVESRGRRGLVAAARGASANFLGLSVGAIVFQAFFGYQELTTPFSTFLAVAPAIALLVIVAPAAGSASEVASLWGMLPTRDSRQEKAATLQISCAEIARCYSLTPRESEVFACLGQGLSPKKTAETLGLSEMTVRSYTKNIHAKVGVQTQPELMRLVFFGHQHECGAADDNR